MRVDLSGCQRPDHQASGKITSPDGASFSRHGTKAKRALGDALVESGVPLVLDLPRHVRSRPPVPVDLHVLVVPRDLQGVAAAQRSLHDLHPAAPVRLVTSGSAPGGLTEGVVAVEMAALASDLALSIHPHPTMSETLMEAAEVFFGHSTHVHRPKKK